MQRGRGGLERGEISNAEMFGNLWNLFRMRSFRKIMKLGADKCKRGQFVQEPGGGGCTMKLGLPSVMSPAVGNHFVCCLTCVLYLYLIKTEKRLPHDVHTFTCDEVHSINFIASEKWTTCRRFCRDLKIRLPEHVANHKVRSVRTSAS